MRTWRAGPGTRDRCATDARQIAAAVPAAYRQQVLVDGSLHGIDLAAPPAPATALRAEAAFLARYAP